MTPTIPSFRAAATPGFASPYAGRNSLTPHQRKETIDATLYVGVRPWAGADAWADPEIDQGFGLSDTLASPASRARRRTRSARSIRISGCSGPSSARPSTLAARSKRSTAPPTSSAASGAPEAIGEAYYNWQAAQAIAVSVDYQLVGDPGYNRDRGPANVFAVRLHGQF